ncbi:maleylpyruvate isomerase family mycothiol-dependent enzyme [Arachnia rubra]|jgi:hypothetical protein|uniref:Maleylpyruvate isomerase family mycothiol-dependent enzyme n=1 Tax=Arachnia rubra TaxID=1547448 RepID=A0ABX7Y7W9_9ACTN|nr:maleylpyruvate isomerase family mycothiol-dependent enzyme [Arachnia rubra]MBB1570741.1 maleylpyruvate isomerase family mycothiol-dependent enzyme [Propionibacterium sp.]MDO4645054.1 maleylpyruvate isomerase family mycothiol-dependent enzyme [Propionibacteriaceae bacterium]MBB1576325.1 maleylpyruvate isomerase family mycothiol-dependent enzyme [Propionibacterium sp.]QUC09307.1 maleylpyruvate isomerase family mycothiol-dependent enzyme [Arachnia rubra]BCR80781.1 hypothetical protein SK1NUM_1
MPSAPGKHFDSILQAVRDQTHALLGRTISYSPEAWAAPTRLQGWTRSHVAAHLIKGARSLAQVCRELLAGSSGSHYDSGLGRDCELLAITDGLHLQIELDTSAGELDPLLTQLAGREGHVQLRPGLKVAIRDLPLVRLRELVLHSFDLEPDASSLEVTDEVAAPLLAFEATYLARGTGSLDIETTREQVLHIDGPNPPRRLVGPAPALLTWLARGIELEELQSSPVEPGQG